MMITLRSKLVLEVSWLAPILQEVGSGLGLGRNSVASSAGELVSVVQQPGSVGEKPESCVLWSGGWMAGDWVWNGQNRCCSLCCDLQLMVTWNQLGVAWRKNLANFAIEKATAMACERLASIRCQIRLGAPSRNRHECVRFDFVLCVRPLRDFSTFYRTRNTRFVWNKGRGERETKRNRKFGRG